ncbi:MAG: LamG domain-containing protein [Proteobacteria bacterium]|nr:LamG domain-containing protein [Pseudomonadota bacterium]
MFIDTPDHGAFSTDGSITVSGRAQRVPAGNFELAINGVVVPVVEGTWTTTVPLDGDAIFNPILAELTILSTGRTIRDRIVVIAGESVPDGALASEAVAIRFNDSGLRNVGSVVAGVVDIDLGTLLPVGTVVSDGVTVAEPPPSLTDFFIEIDGMTGSVTGDVTLLDLEAHFDVVQSGFECGLRIRADGTLIEGDYTLEPDAVDPAFVDVASLNDVLVSFDNFRSDFVSGICNVPVIEQIIGLIVGDIEAQIVEGLDGFLNDPDGSGPLDSPIADAIEDALAGIDLAGAAAGALGLDLEAPLVRIEEDEDGVLLVADTNFTAPELAEGAPDLLASYAAAEPVPSLGPLTPGGEPYGLGFSVSTAAFNQLLKGEIETGLLQAAITEFGSLPITANFLVLLIPEFGSFDPDTPFRIDLRPTLAPVLTGNPGPGGELAELAISQLEVAFVDATTEIAQLTAVIDLRAGLDILFDDDAGSVEFSLGAPAPGSLVAVLLDNPLGADAAGVEALLVNLVPAFLPQVADSLESFPVPSILGLNFQSVETARQGQFLSFFLDIGPERPPYAETILEQAPLEYWRLNDRSRSRARGEVMPPEGDIEVAGGISPNQAGSPGLRPDAGFAGLDETNTWFAFEGGSSALVSVLPELTAASGSVSFWVQNDGGGIEILYYGSSGGGGDGFGGQEELHVNWTDGGNLEFFIEDNLGGGDVRFATSGSYADGEWHHVAATWDATGTALYVDGGALAGGETATGGGSNADYAFTGRHRFGKPAASTREFSGLADELAIWERVLTPEEVAAQFAAADFTPPAPTPPPAYPTEVLDQGPLQYWRLNDTGSSGAPEIEPGQTLTFAGGVDSNQGGAPTLRPDGGFPGLESGNTWLSLDGGSSAVVDNFPGGMSAAVGSVSFWVKTTSQAEEILYYGSTSSDGNGFGGQEELHVNLTPSGGLQLFIEESDGSGDRRVTSASSYADGQWHHVAATWDAGATALYVDGGAPAGGETVTGPGSPATFAFSSRHRLGKPAASQREFQGQVDELALWDRVLSEAEAAAQFEAATVPAP